MTPSPNRISPLRRWMMKMPFMITCEEVESFIAAYLDEELPPNTRKKFEFHIRFCPECRTYLAEYQRTINIGRKAAQSDDLLPLPEDLVKAIVEAKDA